MELEYSQKRRRKAADSAAPSLGSATVELPVEGMTCSGCAYTVETGLHALPGVGAVKADVAGQRVIVTCQPEAVDEATLATRLEEMGYQVAPAKADRTGGMGGLKKLILFVGAVAVVAGLGYLGFRYAVEFYLAPGNIEDLNSSFSSISLSAIGLAFVFGLIVAFSPFTIALAPAVMGYVGGSRHSSRLNSFRLSAGFVSGIAFVDVIIGALFATAGAVALRFFAERLPIFYAIIVVVLLALGLMMLRVWRPNLPALKPRLDVHEDRSVRGAFLLGVPFGLIACPACTPLLLPVALGAAATGAAWYGAALMGAFAIGRGLPLVALGTSTGELRTMREFGQYIPWIEKGIGLLLLAGAAFYLKEFIRVATVFDWL